MDLIIHTVLSSLILIMALYGPVNAKPKGKPVATAPTPAIKADKPDDHEVILFKLACDKRTLSEYRVTCYIIQVDPLQYGDLPGGDLARELGCNYRQSCPNRNRPGERCWGEVICPARYVRPNDLPQPTTKDCPDKMPSCLLKFK